MTSLVVVGIAVFAVAALVAVASVGIVVEPSDTIVIRRPGGYERRPNLGLLALAVTLGAGGVALAAIGVVT